MRIAYLVNQYPTISHTFIRREIQALESLGCAIERFSIRDTAGQSVDPSDQAEAGKTRVVLRPAACLAALARMAVTRPRRLLRALGHAWRLWRNAGRGLVQHAAYLAEACRLTALLEPLEVDHLHAHFGTNSAAVAMLCRDLGGFGYSFTVHGPEEFDRPQALSLGLKVAHAAFVVAVSSFGRSQLQRWTALRDWRKIEVVRCSANPGSFEGEPTSVHGDRFVCIGRLCEQKGHMTLLAAVASLKRRGTAAEVVLVGDGPLRPAMEDYCREHAIGDAVRFVGWQDGEQVRQWLRDARALVLPSFAEGLPVVLMEAFAEQRPAITTYIAGIPELVENGRNGWLVPAGDADALADAMAGVLAASNARLDEMGRCGRTRVLALHHPRRQAELLLRLFETAIRTPP